MAQFSGETSEAESEYSTLRLRSLGDEWITTYPELFAVADFLKGKSQYIQTAQIDDEELNDFALELIGDANNSAEGPVQKAADEFLSDKIRKQEFVRRLVRMMYVTGLVGIRTRNHVTNWAFRSRDFLRDAEIDGTEVVEVCPMFYRVLGTKIIGK